MNYAISFNSNILCLLECYVVFESLIIGHTPWVTSLGYTGYKEGLVADGKRASLAW